MPHFDREDLLRAPIERYLESIGYRSRASELPFFEYSIDVFGYSASTSTTIAVELKLAKWKRAVEQALLYQLGVDFSVIALPQHVIMRIDIGVLNQHGIGLIAIQDDGEGIQVLAPRRSNVTRPHYRERLITSASTVVT